MWTAKLHLSTVEFCVSGSSMVFFFLWVLVWGFFFFERLHQKLVQMRLH